MSCKFKIYKTSGGNYGRHQRLAQHILLHFLGCIDKHRVEHQLTETFERLRYSAIYVRFVFPFDAGIVDGHTG